jgi:site-specific DNA-cytosine methylase
VIRAPDGTWHRPMTTRELACLQSFPDDFMFEGSDSSSKMQPGIREHIGNAVPPDAAEAVAVECMTALMSSADGGYHLSNGNIWVRPEMEWAA